jgi:hypothetical protein
MTRVKMLTTQNGVDDGELHVKPYVEGSEHTIGDSLLKCFIELGAVEIIEHAEVKAEEPAVENKAEIVPSNKSRKKK